MEIMHLVWACQFASTPTPPYCLIYHLLYSLSFPLGPWGHLNWSPVDQGVLSFLKIIVPLMNCFRHFPRLVPSPSGEIFLRCWE